MSKRGRLRLGLAGLGRMGRLHLCNLLRAVEDVEPAAICDAHDATVQQFAAELSVQGYTQFEAMIEEVRLDGVIIATPSSLHASQIRAAAQMGLAVFCEKPVALTLEDALSAQEAVQSKGVHCQIGFQRRFDAAYRRAIEEIQEGSVGEPITFKAVSRDAWEPTLEFARAEVSGGLLIDMGIHDFDLARWLMASEVESVAALTSCHLYPQLLQVGDFDCALVNLLFRSGAVGNIETSRTGTYGYDIRTEVVGTKGAILIGYNERSDYLILQNGEGRRSALPNFETRFHDSFRLQLESFIECVRHERPPVCDILDGVEALRIALAARRSVEEGRVGVGSAP